MYRSCVGGLSGLVRSRRHITGIDKARENGALVFHAGTAMRNGVVTTNKSGRVLNVVGLGNTLADAHATAYAGAEKVRFSGIKYRRDVGTDVILPS